jgi:O-antigen ligase
MWKTVPAFGTFEPRHAENEVLQQLYAYGIAGLLMFVAVYGSLYRCIRRLSNHSVRLIVLCMLLFVLVRGMAEAEPFDLLLPLWMVVLLGTFADCLQKNHAAIETGSNPGFVSPFSAESSGA